MMAELHLIDWASIGINKLSTYDISLAGYPRHNATSLFPAPCCSWRCMVWATASMHGTRTVWSLLSGRLKHSNASGGTLTADICNT